ncbi:unnamed protein product, partial [Symbiodinium pilosum]
MADMAKAEAQLGLQTRILSERCMELQAKMDRSKVSQYDLFGQLEQLRAQNAEQHQQLTDALCESKQRHEENRMLEASSKDLEVQLAECMLSSLPPPAPEARPEVPEALARLERRYVVAEAARDGLARRLKVLEAEKEMLKSQQAKEAAALKQSIAKEQERLESECESYKSQGEDLRSRLAHLDASARSGESKHREELAQVQDRGVLQLSEEKRSHEKLVAELRAKVEATEAMLEKAMSAKAATKIEEESLEVKDL